MDYSIEDMSSRIYSEKTKELFREVKSSYYNGNYRAAVVTLYSVVISDILVKLEVLNEIYTDKAASEILNKVKESQSRNPNTSEWEKFIVDDVKNRTELIDNVDYIHIQALRNDRHLCAHPVIDKEDKLYTPNKETVASHIRNMLESLLLKSPILSKKILTRLLIDIANKKSILIDEGALESYVVAKYLDSITKFVEVAIFRDLWKFVFFLASDEARTNREINFRVLCLLYSRNLSDCIQRIKGEKEYYSNIANEPDTISYLIMFLAESEFLYRELREDARLLVSSYTDKDSNAKTVAWFLSESYAEHLKTVTRCIEEGFKVNNEFLPSPKAGAYKRLLNIGLKKGYKQEVSEFIVLRYSNVGSFDTGDQVFTVFVRPFWDYLTREQIGEMCRSVNNNIQAYGRRRAMEDHEAFKAYLTVRFEDFDFEAYSNVF